MPKRIKIIITTFLFVFSIFIVSINTNASCYDEIKVEVEALVDEGKLPEYHQKLSSNTGYQTLYTKMYRQASAGTKEYFASIEYSNLLR